MPSSPGPNDYTRTPRRFFNGGICLLPQDALPDTKLAWLLNMRSHEEGTIEVRYGQTLASATVLADGIHSIFRLNDTTPYADIGAPTRRFVGAGAGLYGGSPGSTLSLADTGYSGDPMTGVVCPPYASPRPFLYIGDSARLRKINSSFNDYPIGIAQPLAPPSADLAAPETTFLNTVGTTAWTSYGPDTTPGAPTPAPTSLRVNALITDVLYDNGGTDGMCSVVLDDFTNVTPGMTAEIGALTETAIIQDVLPAISGTTIAAILYDSGVGGLCTIQPEGSFSAGQIELPNPVQVRRRYADLNDEAPPPVTITRTVDYPVNALIVLNGVETVRILSIAVGQDGVMSFRCSTAGTYAAGATITGVASFRAFCQTSWSVGDAVTAQELDVTLTPTNTDDPFIGGVQAPISGGSRDWTRVGTRATQPEDIIRFGIKVSDLGYVESVRLVLDLSPTGPAFLKDYYFYEWRASDLVSAIQATSEIATGLVADAQADAVRQGLVTGLYGNGYGQQDIQTVQSVDSDLAVVNQSQAPAQPDHSAREAIARSAPVPVGGGVARQLALGNDAWMTLECRAGDLIRVGTDTTLTLGTILNALITVQTKGIAAAVSLSFSDVYLTGGYGPDVGLTLPPYVYRYSYRSTITGERSNSSPPMRAGVLPRRGRVTLSATPSLDPQCDAIDWWRFGGSLARWAYVGTCPNDGSASPFVADFTDDMADRMIDGGRKIWVDQYQPFPVSDLPRTGTARLAGTALEWVSGDTFNTSWAADTLIIVNGRATQLYRSPTSTTRLEVVDNCGSGDAVDFFIPSPTILSQPLGAIWGGTIGGTWFTFACADPTDPGALHWTNSNDPDASSDGNVLIVTTASEPLINGFYDNGVPYVFSSGDLYRITPTPGEPSPFRALLTNCGRGLWSRWAMAVAPDGGCYFLAKDGIYYTSGGGAAIPLIDPDLKPLFPQEGTVPEAIRNMNPVDMTATTALVLTFVDQVLYFDYVDTEGEYHTLVFEPKYKRWTLDTYAVGATARLGEPGPQVETHLVGRPDGRLVQVDSESLVDIDANGDLADVPWALWPDWANGGDPRAWKQWGDAILDFNPGGSLTGILVTPVINNGNVAMTQQTIGAGGTVRDTFLVEVGTGGGLGYGVISRNFGLLIEGSVQACDTQRPIFYLWEPAFLPKGTSVARRATDWEDLGYKGAKFIQGVVIRANTFGETKTVQVQFDGPNGAPQVALTLSLLHDGEMTIAYPMADTGWQPFHAELVRLQGADDVEWALLDWRFVWEPAPELATQWETQDTTFDLPGFLSVRDGVMAYAADADVELVVWHDDVLQTYVLPATSGEYIRAYVLFAAQKGKAARFQWSSTLPFRLYKRDCSVRVQGWGLPGGYQVVSPFGGPSRVDGAGI